LALSARWRQMLSLPGSLATVSQVEVLAINL
jgi:hypothetical protein